jgi:hypothetical protein
VGVRRCGYHPRSGPAPRRDYSPRLTSASQWASNSTHFLVLKELRQISTPVELKTGFGGFWYPKYFERRTESCARQGPGNWPSIRNKVTESGQVPCFGSHWAGWWPGSPLPGQLRYVTRTVNVSENVGLDALVAVDDALLLTDAT